MLSGGGGGQYNNLNNEIQQGGVTRDLSLHSAAKIIMVIFYCTNRIVFKIKNVKSLLTVPSMGNNLRLDLFFVQLPGLIQVNRRRRWWRWWACW